MNKRVYIVFILAVLLSASCIKQKEKSDMMRFEVFETSKKVLFIFLFLLIIVFMKNLYFLFI